MGDMNMRALLGRGRELLGRMRPGDTASRSPGTFSLLALRLERDLQQQVRGHSLMVTATDDDAVGVEAAVELAWCLAEDLGHSVLLVDGAFAGRKLSTALGVAEKTGLAEIFEASDRESPTLASNVQPTLHERIFVLPQGNDAGDPAIRVDAIRELLVSACERYEFVLVQGSLLDDGSRSLAFCSLVDAALLIAVEEKSTLDQVIRGQRLLNDCGATRVALVLANRPRAPRINGR
jgi:Mrp family chromosome partitioning ATPase